jgi:large subunit ribosomal protein L21e
MKKKKSKGKISRIFQQLEEGDRVGVTIEPSEKTGFPKRMQGRTGVVEGKRGKAYIVKIADGNKNKRFIIKPVHLRKLG